MTYTQTRMKQITQKQITAEGKLYDLFNKQLKQIENEVKESEHKVDSVLTLVNDKLITELSSVHGKKIMYAVASKEGHRISIVYYDADKVITKTFLHGMYVPSVGDVLKWTDSKTIRLPELKWSLKHYKRCADHWNRAVIHMSQK